MCGIAGIIELKPKRADVRSLHPMIEALHHRGPDAQGCWSDGPVALGHARLSIIDPDGGAQPMLDADETICLTFNGEIFNYVELRAELASKGYEFETHSDTEVLLRLYEDRGEACVDDLNGQFAFAIWDGRTNKLFAARDRLGIRPFYYTIAEGRFLFASEMKALLTQPGVSRDIDPIALDQIFTLWCTLPERTIFAGIASLPPGHRLRVVDGRVEVSRYWSLDYARDPREHEMAADEAADALLALLVDATRLRLRADVPVGAYLSGGLDSSVIAGLVGEHTSNHLETFSVAFEDPEFDESAYQTEVSRRLGTRHHSLRCTSGDIGRAFPDVIEHTETPIIRTAPTPLYLLSALVRETGFKVVLTGEGADEVLGGYDIFKESKLRRFWARDPGSRMRPRLLKRLYPYLQDVQEQPGAYLEAFFHVRPQDLASPFYSHLPRWELTAKSKVFFSNDLKRAIGDYDVRDDLRGRLPAEYDRWDSFAQAQYLETTVLLPGYILSSQGDRMAMAHSVEGRFPFLDHRVVEFAAKLPPALKMKVLDEKHLLKRAAQGLVPDAVVKRKKQPYRAPDAVSLLGDGVAGQRPDWARRVLEPTRIESDGLFSAPAVDKLIRKFEAGRAIGVKDNQAMVGIASAQLVADSYSETTRR